MFHNLMQSTRRHINPHTTEMIAAISWLLHITNRHKASDILCIKCCLYQTSRAYKKKSLLQAYVYLKYKVCFKFTEKQNVNVCRSTSSALSSSSKWTCKSQSPCRAQGHTTARPCTWAHVSQQDWLSCHLSKRLDACYVHLWNNTKRNQWAPIWTSKITISSKIAVCKAAMARKLVTAMVQVKYRVKLWQASCLPAQMHSI